ncbi:hypothetical protein N0V88_003222 [Collariella sp. IMI 366227]|nr:hypothetical protein N0V88_003222 [Collariella sp. IMI 366227]
MKVPAALLTLALAGAAVAQLPACAQKCADPYLINGIGDCSGGDVKCICSDKDFLGGIACCLADGCSETDKNTAIDFALNLCKGVGVTDLPTQVLCNTAAPSTSVVSTAPTSGSAGTAPTSTPPAQTTGNTAGADTATTTSKNAGPKPTAAAAGFGAIGGLMAAVALL